MKGRKLGRNDLKKELMRYLLRHPDQVLTSRQLIKRLKIGNDKNHVVKALNELAKQGQVRSSNDGFSLGGSTAKVKQERKSEKTYTGRVDMVRSGDAYIICDDLEEDVFVRADNLGTALNRDTVEIVLRGRGRGRVKGRVVRVIKRATEQFIGTFYSFRNYGIVVPQSRNAPFDIIIDKEKDAGAEHGDTVVVQVTGWDTGKGRAPSGEVHHVLGAPGSSEIEMQSILLTNGFNVRFPEEVEEEAARLPKGLSEKDFEGRRDFSDVTTFTIDPATAKDFDDALSVRTLENGNVEVGVHIADVTHFVKPGTAIDDEAYRRSTSVYLVDRVAPMLPEELSNELCSLRPHETSLCFSAVFTFDSRHRIVDRWFGKTYIFSNHRFAYEEAQEVMDSGDGPYRDEIIQLREIARSLRKRKLENGALTFETDEVQFVLDDNGVPIEIYAKERKEAHMLIEDFMLLANREVAAFIGETRHGDRIPFVYRIHDHPDPDKIADLAMFARMLGFKMQIDTPLQIAKSFNALAEAAREDDALKILEPLAIRSMAKAEYNTENIGHYGLAFTFYTHFTSPIRRYSDVLVHRILFENIAGRTQRRNEGELQDQCKHISTMERAAQASERESIKYKQTEYMTQFVGQEFDGHISGMIDRGIFVKLDQNHVEGLVSFGSMDEPFGIDESRMSATGLRTGEILRMGGLVRVKITDANLAKRQVDMALVDLETPD